MPAVRKILGQSKPAAATPGTLYTVPASTEAVTSTLVIANTGAGVGTVDVWVKAGGGAVTASNAVMANTPVSAGDSLFITIGMSLSATDAVTVESDTGDVTFTLFGVEVTS